MIRDIGCLFFLIILLSSGCSSSPEQVGSGEASSQDTSYYIPEGSSSPAIQAKHVDTVRIVDMKFQPEEIHSQKGDSIIWINEDMVSHCVTEERTKAWTSSVITAGGSWKMAVNENAAYFCAIHMVMKGRIVLESSTASAIK